MRCKEPGQPIAGLHVDVDVGGDVDGDGCQGEGAGELSLDAGWSEGLASEVVAAARSTLLYLRVSLILH